ncbi:MAG TPA: M48 family metallopeptidase [Edaphobacter sp.]|nr:M48 family metallopeptidase [Edaphobacter sp.]
MTALLWLIALSLPAVGYAQSAAPVFPNPGKVSMSREDQRSLGMQAASEVYKTMPVLPDSSPETKYIRQLGQKLVATIPPQYSWPFEFHVVAQKDINAFALPGGPMFVNIGTIVAAENEAQLAGVMSHEMSHVIMQHSAKQAGKAQTTGLLAGIAGAVLGGVAGDAAGGMVGELGQMGIQMTAQGMMLKYSRGDESQADAVGAIIMYKAGYNPQAMADFFKTLETEGGQSPPQWLSDHPNPGNRQLAIQKEIQNWPPENYIADSPAFAKVRQEAKSVKAYTGQEIAEGAKSGQWASFNQKNGATFTPTGATRKSAVPASGASPAPSGASGSSGVSGSPDASPVTATNASASPNTPAIALESIAPSSRMIKANLGPVKIQYPDNWQVKMPEQRGEFVAIAPAAGVTPNGVGYGLLLNGVAPPHGGSANIDDVTSELVKQMKQNNGLQVLSNAEPITVNGIQGRSVLLETTSPFLNANGQQQKENDWLVTVPQHDGSVIFMVFVAPQTEFSRLEPTYRAMLRSMQVK